MICGTLAGHKHKVPCEPLLKREEGCIKQCVQLISSLTGLFFTRETSSGVGMGVEDPQGMGAGGQFASLRNTNL